MSDELNISEELAFSAEPAGTDSIPESFRDEVGDGFNEYGVRENTDDEGNLQSVDVLYHAMEPGPPERRNGVRIRSRFLENVASKDYSHEPPFLKDHDKKDTFAKLGRVKKVAFADDGLWLMNRVRNIEGSRNHQEAIARYTVKPPEIIDGSVGLGSDYTAVRNEKGEPELRDATLKEFSTTNFPGGYDEGGLAASFAEAAVNAADFEVDDEPNGGSGSENSGSSVAVRTETINV